MPAKIVLASSSPFRRALLERLGLPFEALSPAIDEMAHADESPAALAQRLAVAKARAVAARRPAALVIGSDQVAVYDGAITGKPRDHADAVRQLRAASGRKVMLYTGLALLNAATGRVQCEVIPFGIQFRPLTDAQIENYLRQEQPYDCTGSVKSEGLGIALLERFEGDDPNALIGLPLIRLIRMLEQEGVALI
ncbi:MAG: septum formation protein Maf [Candidatus Muproteobacteria bacterium RBG_16_60_9]|uniref:7-methyl-GTP pyrophosphatase n=1 Tax=Candidatus Muproteobacteria bacterium RBG_16_60_9 TaxID=1817755 RepID=A0A1F6VDM4_9PROT|nr:MAG: septum formation protein Maf [Candidatus Muproteobacteria bacterium RBG_16_60_9]